MAIAWLAVVMINTFTRDARADEPSAAERAAQTALVPIEDVHTLELPQGEIDEALLGLPIARVEVRVLGQTWASKVTVASVKVGELLTPELARRAMRELSDRGGFSGLAAEAEKAGTGVVLRVFAVPSRTLDAVQVDGGVLDRAATLSASGLVLGTEITGADLAEIPARVRAHYAERGFPRAIVSVEATELDDPLTVLVSLTVDPGEPRLITQRVFVIDPEWDAHVGDLKLGYAAEADDRLDLEALVEADRALAERLREAGFYKARVYHKIRTVGPHAYLYVYVDSGPKLLPVFEGQQSFDADQLLRALQLDEGQVADPRELGEKLRRHYVAHGFLDAEVAVQNRTSDDRGVELFAFVIQERDRVQVVRRVFVCLPKEIDPSDVGGEIDAILEEDLPDVGVFSVPAPTVIDPTLSTNGGTGRRAAPLELSPATTYAPEVYPRALKQVREVFLGKGYLNAIVGPVGVVRARCAASSPPDACVEEPLPTIKTACLSNETGLPVAEPTLPPDATCVPNVAKGIRCSPNIVLRIPTHLGPITRVWDLAFEGNRSVTDRALADVAKLEMGVPLSLERVDEAKGRIVAFYQDRGHAFVSVDAEIEPSPDRTRARTRFLVEERERVIIDGVDVEGALRTDPELILRRVSLEKGDYYSKTGLRVSQERIATLGVFSSVSVSLVDPEVPQRRKRILVRVTEYPSQYIEPKVGFSTGEGLRVGLEYGHRNIGALAIALTLRLELSYLFDFMILDPAALANLEPLSFGERLERRNSVRVAFPEIGLGPLVSFGIEGVDVRDNQRDFGLSREALVPSLTYRPTRELFTTLSASVEVNDEKIFSASSVDEAIKKNRSLERLLRFPDGTTFAVAQRLAGSWDRRDNPFAATSGTLITADIEHVNAFPADPDDPETDPIFSHFLRIQGRLAGYVRFTDGGIALAVSLGAGGNIQLADGSRTYPDRLFFLGGFDSIRSFLSDSVVPEDVAEKILAGEVEVEDIAVRGGDLSINPRVEVRVPITETFAVGIFLDTANLWVDPAAFSPIDLRYGAGGGLRVSTPIGPLALDYGFNLERREWEDLGALHFSIGLF